MIPLGAGDTLQAVASTANKLSFVSGYVDLATDAIDIVKGSSGGYLPGAAAAQLTAGASGALVRIINVVNTDTVNRTVTLYVNGATDADRLIGPVTLPAGYTLAHDDSGWAVYTDQGQRLGIGATGAAGSGLTDGDKGDITVSSSGTVWSVDAQAITFAKFQNITTDRLLGRDTAASGSPEEVSVGGGLEFTGGPGIGIAARGVTYAKFQAVVSNNRILGRVSGAAGDVEELTVAQVMALNPNPTINVYSASTTWTKPAGARFVRVRVVGCGGGGGGAASSAAGTRSGAGGGGGGGYAEKVFAASALGSTETITIGSVGAAGAAGNNNGGTGGTCSFGASGTLVSATGGAGGEGSAASGTQTTHLGGTGGVGSGGDLNAKGQGGGYGLITPNGVTGGWGGATVLGAGGDSVDVNVAGNAGSAYGGGGAGGVVGVNSGTARAGGAGALGVVIVETYY